MERPGDDIETVNERDAGSPSVTDEEFSKRRIDLVNTAVKEWTDALVDLGGRNNLLNYRDLKAGTLDMTAASPPALSKLLGGTAIKTSSLFTDPDLREANAKRFRTIARKARENFEERGLDTLSIACGLTTWNNEAVAGWTPAAPVLLRQASIRPLGAAQDDFELVLTDEMEVNPTLLHFLKTNFDCSFDQERLLDRLDGVIDEPWELEEVYDWLVEHGARIPDFEVAPRIVLANFAYAKLPMVKDLESAFDELVAHDLIAAIAGDEDAREAVRESQPDPDDIPSVDEVPPADEFLVLDADSSQSWVIDSAIDGESMIVRGPPGTGKSQTIANLIGSLIARDKRVLFVAEKRAAIEAVAKRLDACGIGDLVLDLHGGIGSRRQFAATLAAALKSSRTAPSIDRAPEQRKLAKRRDELNDYVRALHEERLPWRLTIYDVRTELLALEEFEIELRFSGGTLTSLTREVVQACEETIEEYARLGGFALKESGSPWADANIASQTEAIHAYQLAENLRRTALPNSLEALRTAADNTKLPEPEGNLTNWEQPLALWREIVLLLRTVEPSIFDLELDELIVTLEPARAGGLARLRSSLVSGDYRAARGRLRACSKDERPPDSTLLDNAETARDIRRQWRELGGQVEPNQPPDLDGIATSYGKLRERLQELSAITAQHAIDSQPPESVQRGLDALLADRGTLMNLPRIHTLRAELREAGLNEYVEAMEAATASEEKALATFRWIVLRSVLDAVAMTDRLVDGFQPDQHERAVTDFVSGDREHLQSAPARIRRACAEQAATTRDEHSDQSDLLEHQARLKRRHRPVRDLVHDTSDVLLALKPCWAMSPLAVSQLLPARTLFDVVIFDEASQVTPADAIPAILRGGQLVVAGDEKQLPPTAFFASDSGPDEAEEHEDDETPRPAIAGTVGFESILDGLGSLLRPRMLQWHYRSQDERLIAFSNAHIYDRMLTTFPGAGRNGQVLRHVVASHDPTADTNSPSPEVRAVVDLIIEHARTRPEESLGVITMGIKHANRIEESLLDRLREDTALRQELEEFLREDREERYFVKNLERVQGDERDAIILSIGYGKNSRGDLPFRFGPLLTDGGERRLNVAVTRAKKRMTLVSSFEATDMDPERSNASGVKLLRQYLQYFDSGGSDLGDVLLEKPELNPFEADVRDSLQRHGLRLIPQYGASGYWIDFAVSHPEIPGAFVLALECDGATYHSSASARDRDRLRQEQLERIGWRFHRIWSTEWFYDKDKCVDKALEAYRTAVEVHDRTGTDRAGTAVGTQEAPIEVTALDVVPARRQDPPPVFPGLAIDSYTHDDLVAMVQWIKSDDMVRTREEILTEAMAELGFKRRGAKIVTAIEAAIEDERGL